MREIRVSERFISKRIIYRRKFTLRRASDLLRFECDVSIRARLSMNSFMHKLYHILKVALRCEVNFY